ncbi:hypothetical protein KAU55_05800, partial [Candidatus Bathyarchaeota archaeon]|nr:hypothetical protein [Candidatus Bathyarchaeota archaeon]
LKTISQIGASGIPTITVLNKIDLLPETELNKKLETLKERVPNPVLISALYKISFDLLKRRILKTLKNYVEASFTVPLTSESMSFVSWLFNRADVQELKYTGSSAHVVFEAIPWFVEKVRKRVEEEFNGKFEEVKTIKA